MSSSLIPEHFHHHRKKAHTHQRSPSPPPPSPSSLATADLSVCVDMLITGISYKWDHTNAPFCGRLPSLSIMFSSFICAAAQSVHRVFLVLSRVCLCGSIASMGERHSACLHVLAAMSLCGQALCGCMLCFITGISLAGGITESGGDFFGGRELEH